MLRRLLGRMGSLGTAEHQTDYRDLESGAEGGAKGLHAEYEKLILFALRRWGVAPECTEVEVHQIGQSADGRGIFVAAVRLQAWERKSGLRLLLGLPLLESRIRKAVRAHWVAEVSHFGGVWLHASEKLTDGPAGAQLAELVVSLTKKSAADPAGAGE